MDEAAGQSGAEEEPSATSVARHFGDDDLGRLQNILLGDHARETGERIDRLERALLELQATLEALTSSIDELRATTRRSAELADSKVDRRVLADLLSTIVEGLENPEPG